MSRTAFVIIMIGIGMMLWLLVALFYSMQLPDVIYLPPGD